MEIVRLGIVGLGRLGREHAANINYNITNAELAAICSAFPKEVESVMKEMNPGYGTTDYMELFNDRNLDGIVIVSNPAHHCQMICDAANAGVKNIFCEEPLGMTLEEIDLVMETCEKNNVLIFQIGYIGRFDRSLMTMKQEIDKGIIGKPILIKLVNRDPEWDKGFLLGYSPASGGLVFDMLTHDYDTARFLIESDAETIYGMGGVFGYEGLLEINDIDNCIVTVGFKNGVMGHFESSRNSTYGYHIEVEVFGTKGCLRMSTVHSNDKIITMSVNGVTTDCGKLPFEFWEPALKAELQDFVDCIQNGSQPRVGLIDGYKATKWAFAAKEAVDKQMIVEVGLEAITE